MSVIEISDASFEQEVVNSPKPVLVEFGAEWCQPCKQLLTVLDELSPEMEAQVTFAKVDLDKSPETPASYGVRSVPTLMLFKGGEVVATKAGAGGMTKGKLAEWVSENA